MHELLHVEDSVTDAAVVVTVVGDLDMNTAGAFRERLRTVRPLALSSLAMSIDLRAVQFLGSAGLAALLDTHNWCTERGVAVQLVATQRAILRPLEITGLTGTLRVVPALPAEVAGQQLAALTDRAIIAQAVGVLIAERRVRPDQAQAILAEQARRDDVTLRDLAHRILVEHGRSLPRSGDAAQGGDAPSHHPGERC
jgi:anti-sigma B factor antagonist